MKSEPSSNQDNFNYIQSVEFIQRNWIVIAASIFLCVAVAVSVYALVKPTWKAVAVLRVGMLAMSDKQNARVETLGEITERLKLDKFTANVFARIGMSTDDSTKTIRKRYEDTLRVLPVKNTEYAQVSLIATTSDQALEQVDAVVNEIIVSHNAINEPIVKNLQMQLADTENRIQALLNEISSLEKTLASKKESGNTESSAVFLFMFLSNKEAELSKLTIRQAELKIFLSPTRNYSTSLLEPPKTVKVRPPLVWFLFIGLLGGGMLGAFLVWYQEKKRSRH